MSQLQFVISTFNFLCRLHLVMGQPWPALCRSCYWRPHKQDWVFLVCCETSTASWREIWLAEVWFHKICFLEYAIAICKYSSYHPIVSSCLMTPSSAIWQPSYGGGFVGTKAKMISMSFFTYSPLLSELKIKTLTTPGWFHLSFNWIFVCFLAPSKNEGTHLARVPLLCKRVCQ